MALQKYKVDHSPSPGEVKSIRRGEERAWRCGGGGGSIRGMGKIRKLEHTQLGVVAMWKKGTKKKEGRWKDNAAKQEVVSWLTWEKPLQGKTVQKNWSSWVGKPIKAHDEGRTSVCPGAR